MRLRLSRPWPTEIRVETEVNKPIPQQWNGVVTCLIYYVDEGLSIVPLGKFGNIGRPHVWGDRFHDGEKFILGDGAADQAL